MLTVFFVLEGKALPTFPILSKLAKLATLAEVGIINEPVEPVELINLVVGAATIILSVTTGILLLVGIWIATGTLLASGAMLKATPGAWALSGTWISVGWLATEAVLKANPEASSVVWIAPGASITSGAWLLAETVTLYNYIFWAWPVLNTRESVPNKIAFLINNLCSLEFNYNICSISIYLVR